MNEIAISTDLIKLDSFLKFCQIAESGGVAKMMVSEGWVRVDGEVCLQRGRKLYKGMTVEVRIPGEEDGKYDTYEFKVA
jgi:ribosome-associated protein